MWNPKTDSNVNKPRIKCGCISQTLRLTGAVRKLKYTGTRDYQNRCSDTAFFHIVMLNVVDILQNLHHCRFNTRIIVSFKLKVLINPLAHSP